MNKDKAVIKTFTVYPEHISKLDRIFRRTYRNQSELVRLAIERLYDHPEEWPIDKDASNTYREHSQAERRE